MRSKYSQRTASAIANNPTKVSQNDNVHDFVSPEGRTPPALRSFRSFSRRWRQFGNQIKQLCVTAIREALRRQPEVGDLRTAAFVTAINKVAIVYEELGIFP